MKWSNLPHGTFPPDEEKYVLPLPLRQPQELMGSCMGRARAQGYRFDAERRQENRVCHGAEHFGAPSSTLGAARNVALYEERYTIREDIRPSQLLPLEGL